MPLETKTDGSSSWFQSDARAGRKVYARTFGCQMNVYDTERMLELLSLDGYEPVASPDDADLILVNTCAIRDKAEQKLFSALGVYRRQKQRREDVLICVSGCVAQDAKEKLLERIPYVDLVIGPDSVPRVATLVREARERGTRLAEAKFIRTDRYSFPRALPRSGGSAATAFVTIQKGCNKLCTYCIVPFTRGREVSRPVEEILAEVSRFIECGAREVTLIGQNVNCYSGGCTFAELLVRVSKVRGLSRLRYFTSHPTEMGDDIFRAHRDISVLCPHLHIPVQSGSDRMLSLMRREHTIAEYREKIARLREARDDIALTSDIIVGFPGETEEDFEATMSLVEDIRFTNLFSFIYSERPKTWASRNGPRLGLVPKAVQVSRLEQLQERQREISLSAAQAWLDREVVVLVEGPSKKDPTRRKGHSLHNWMVHFTATEEQAPTGAIVSIKVGAASHVGLSGSVTGILSLPERSGDCHAREQI